jgi:hypothetical protein
MQEKTEGKNGKEYWKRSSVYIFQRLDGLSKDLLDKALDKFFRIMQNYVTKHGGCRLRFLYWGSISDGQEAAYWSTTWYGAYSEYGLKRVRAEFQEIADLADFPLVLYGLPDYRK